SRLNRLQFKQKLVSSSKQISTTELCKRLKSLFGEISRIDQEEIEIDSLRSITRDLIHPSLIKHKDKGIKAYASCCISDLLRLYAPDAPYTGSELKVIFDLFVRQLQNIGNISGPYFDLYFHLLENLARVKIVLLILDLQSHEELLVDLFRNIFDVVRPEMSSIVHSHMVDILAQLINESHEALPQEVIEIILAQFLKKRKDENPAAYKLAGEVCNASTEKLQRYICQYFTDVIVAAGKAGAPAEELNDFKIAHDLIKELNRTAPGLLLNVIPQLEEELKLDDLNLRMLATQVLGEMFSEKNSTLASRYDNPMCAVHGPNIAFPYMPTIMNWPSKLMAIISKMSDPDDKVRIAVCRVFSQLEYECASKLVGKELFVELAKRCRDRKHGVRQEAIKALARLYNLAYAEIVDRDANAVEKFGWIPSEILNTLYTNDNDIMYLIVIVASYCDDRLKIDSDQLSTIILQKKLPDPLKSANNLSSFPKLQDIRCCKMIRDCMNPLSNYRTVKKSAEEALKRIGQKAASSLETFSILIRRISMTIINRDLIPSLLTKIKSTDSEQDSGSNVAHELFKDVSSRFPSIFKPHLDELIKSISENENENPLIVDDSLQALSKLSTAFPDEIPHDRVSIRRFTKYALEGNPRQAKFSATILTHILHREEICGDLLKEIVPKLSVASQHLLAHLSALGQCALFSLESFGEESEAITNFIIKQLIMKTRHRTTTASDIDWVDDDELGDECKAKVLGLKVLVNRLIAVRKTEAAVDLAKPVFKLLWTLIREGGELLPDKSTRYIDFFLDTIANSENVSFLLYISGRLKQVRDAQSLDQSENLYALSDIAQYLIRAKSKANSWSLPAYPGQAKLPGDLFKSLPSPEVMKRNYIPNEFLKELEKTHSSAQNKSEKSKINKKSRKKTSNQSPPKRRRTSLETPQPATRKAAKSKILSMADSADRSSDDQEDDESDEMDESS
ncbi:13092_t:CDS:10, partial [Acaulospora colombiana]